MFFFFILILIKIIFFFFIFLFFFVFFLFFFFFFFFSSRRRHTRFSRDWSSDVCSSDLPCRLQRQDSGGRLLLPAHHRQGPARLRRHRVPAAGDEASECACSYACACDRDHLRGQARRRQIGRASCRERV